MKLVFDYNPELSEESIMKILDELYPEYPKKIKSHVIRMRKNGISTVGIDVKEDFQKRQSIVQVYQKPSVGASLIGPIIINFRNAFVNEVALTLKSYLGSRYKLIEESNKTRPRLTLRNKVGYAYLGFIFAAFVGILILVGRDMKNNNNPNDSTEIVASAPVEYQGLSLKIPDDWSCKTLEQADGLVHTMMLSGENDFVSISWGSEGDVLEPGEWIQKCLNDMKENYETFSANTIAEFTYCEENAFYYDFSFNQSGILLYSRRIAFKKNGRNILIQYLSDSSERLKNKLGFVEETLSF